MKKVAVIGAGFMGFQIALQSAVHEFDVTLFDVSEESLKGAEQKIRGELGSRLNSGAIPKSVESKILQRFTYCTDLREAVVDADVIIEAAPEDIELKKSLLRDISHHCHENSLIATNSSSLRISQVESEMEASFRAVNMHFYPPVWQRGFAEVMGGSATTPETIKKAESFIHLIGLTPLKVQKESTGFIFNRVWRAIKKECLEIADQGVASHEDVDRAWMLAFGTPAGPFGLMDMVGLDVVKDIEEVYHRESGADRDRVPAILHEMLDKGELGIKSGKGFYSYPKPAYQKENWLRG